MKIVASYSPVVEVKLLRASSCRLQDYWTFGYFRGYE